MGLSLGIDGKRKAMEASKGAGITAITTLYVGLLQTAPANMDGMDLATLINPVNGNEFSLSPNFYDMRREITIGAVMADHSGATASNNNVAAIEWTNNTGSIINVEALFITDAASGSSGQVMWVGTPDAGTATIAVGAKASIITGDLILRID